MQYLSLVLVVSSILNFGAIPAEAHSKSVTIYRVTAEGSAEVGTVRFDDSQYGLMIQPDLRGLLPGPHAVHVHENPSCLSGSDGSPAGAAGSHYDPDNSGKHLGPYADGHLGDLPNLIVEQDGTAKIPTLAPRVTKSDLMGRALILHAGTDFYNGHAAHAHGKGGGRMYCGVIGE